MFALTLLLAGCQNPSPKIVKKNTTVSCEKPHSTCSKIGKITADIEHPNSRTWTTDCLRCKKTRRLILDKAITRGANYVWLQPSTKSDQVIGIAYWCPNNCK